MKYIAVFYTGLVPSIVVLRNQTLKKDYYDCVMNFLAYLRVDNRMLIH